MHSLLLQSLSCVLNPITLLVFVMHGATLRLKALWANSTEFTLEMLYRRTGLTIINLSYSTVFMLFLFSHHFFRVVSLMIGLRHE